MEKRKFSGRKSAAATCAMSETMTFAEAKKKARKGIKVTHIYFADDEYMTMRGNQIVFEDGVTIFVDEWAKGKDYLNDGWSLFYIV